MTDAPDHEFGPVSHRIEPRWAMNYAAAVLDPNPALLGESRTVHCGYLAHLEWLIRQRIREAPVLAGARSVVQLTSSTSMMRPLEWDDDLEVTGRISSITPTATATVVATEFVVTHKTTATTAAITTATSLYRGLKLPPMADLPPDEHRMPPPGHGQLPLSSAVEIEFTDVAAHVYSECARIWVPFHTDLRESQRAGFPRLILHGTATLSYCLSALLGAVGVTDHARVKHFRCGFRKPVFVGTRARLVYATHEDETGTVVDFELRDPEGVPLLSDGVVTLAPAPQLLEPLWGTPQSLAQHSG
ncbi:MaoC/PaaZ C-terminal domain-containing protein [Georgenia ruanii]|uniref:MaoC-like domain-containing protein n=1 Tax=Georgenia ruanii TaxID=348442 RepID=A0A7J9USN6_9MICO|nr:MaoC/PaaZ C-terminal domain-containing protein [Georgenia ruanii]MPV87626.1 hypothetical protein [Georgenia ruanii]